MTKKTIITVLLALLTMSANSQGTGATVDSAPGWLWEISGNYKSIVLLKKRMPIRTCAPVLEASFGL
jgi:hypothetical protein